MGPGAKKFQKVSIFRHWVILTQGRKKSDSRPQKGDCVAMNGPESVPTLVQYWKLN